MEYHIHNVDPSIPLVLRREECFLDRHSRGFLLVEVLHKVQNAIDLNFAIILIY